MNLYCDNYQTCRSVVFAQSTDALTEQVARARNWRVFHGKNLHGFDLDVVLCTSCSKLPRPQAPEPVLEGQEALFPPPGDPGTVEQPSEGER